jgi:hypothetical protein
MFVEQAAVLGMSWIMDRSPVNNSANITRFDTLIRTCCSKIIWNCLGSADVKATIELKWGDPTSPEHGELSFVQYYHPIF